MNRFIVFLLLLLLSSMRSFFTLRNSWGLQKAEKNRTTNLHRTDEKKNTSRWRVKIFNYRTCGEDLNCFLHHHALCAQVYEWERIFSFLFVLNAFLFVFSFCSAVRRSCNFFVCFCVRFFTDLHVCCYRLVASRSLSLSPFPYFVYSIFYIFQRYPSIRFLSSRTHTLCVCVDIDSKLNAQEIMNDTVIMWIMYFVMKVLALCLSSFHLVSLCFLFVKQCFMIACIYGYVLIAELSDWVCVCITLLFFIFFTSFVAPTINTTHWCVAQ